MNKHYIQQNGELSTAILSCSPNIQRFLTKLDDGSAPLKWDLIQSLSLEQNDGSIFRVVSSYRNAKNQIAEYKRGRNVKYDNICHLTGDKLHKGTEYKLTFSEVTNSVDISTNAWACKSYHNYGLAVDIVFRTLGEGKDLPNRVSYNYPTLKSFYTACGLIDWASACSLDWGGNWEGFVDVAHWQDKTYVLPPDDVLRAEHCTFQFIKDYNAGNYTETVPLSNTKKQVFSVLGILSLCGLGYLIYSYVKKGKK